MKEKEALLPLLRLPPQLLYLQQFLVIRVTSNSNYLWMVQHTLYAKKSSLD
jgi:hypothetical protein